MTKSLQLLKELLEEDKLDIKEVMEVLGYEIVEFNEITHTMISGGEGIADVEVEIGYDEVITIKKEHR